MSSSATSPPSRSVCPPHPELPLTPRSPPGTGARPPAAPSSPMSHTTSSPRTHLPLTPRLSSPPCSATSGGSSENYWEIMIWLANYNSGPISYDYDSAGNAEPIESGLSIAGYTWYAPSVDPALTLMCAQGSVLRLERVQLRVLLPPVEHGHELLWRCERVPHLPHQRAEPPEQPVPHHF